MIDDLMCDYDFYIIHSRSLSDFAIARTELLEDQGFRCFLPCRDLDDSGLPSRTSALILNAISNSRKAKLYWDGVSHGAVLDFGVCLGKEIEIDEIVWSKKGQVHSLVQEMEGKIRHGG